MDILDKIKQNPLFYAAKNGHNKVCGLLIDNGCNMNQIDEYNKTPIQIANKEKQMKTVEFLLKKGALDPGNYFDKKVKKIGINDKANKKTKKEKNLVEYKLMYTKNNLNWKEAEDEEVKLL